MKKNNIVGRVLAYIVYVIAAQILVFQGTERLEEIENQEPSSKKSREKAFCLLSIFSISAVMAAFYTKIDKALKG